MYGREITPHSSLFEFTADSDLLSHYRQDIVKLANCFIKASSMIQIGPERLLDKEMFLYRLFLIGEDDLLPHFKENQPQVPP